MPLLIPFLLLLLTFIVLLAYGLYLSSKLEKEKKPLKEEEPDIFSWMDGL